MPFVSWKGTKELGLEMEGEGLYFSEIQKVSSVLKQELLVHVKGMNDDRLTT